MALPSVDYAPRDPAADVLHRVAREHLQTFIAEAVNLRDGDGGAALVGEEFRAFLACGFLAVTANSHATDGAVNAVTA